MPKDKPMVEVKCKITTYFKIDLELPQEVMQDQHVIDWERLEEFVQKEFTTDDLPEQGDYDFFEVVDFEVFGKFGRLK